MSDLKAFALENQTDRQGNHRSVLVLKNDRLQARNYVGIIETRKRETRCRHLAHRHKKKLNFFKKCDKVCSSHLWFILGIIF